jgi:Flp pilus assembly protein TadG
VILEKAMEPLRRIVKHFDNHNRSQKGAILFVVAACLVVLLGFMGLAIDLGHAYNNKTQLQNMADACALAGASALNGSSEGIQEATDRARDASSRLSNKKEFNTLTVTLAEGDVSFSDTLNGTYIGKTAAQGVAATIRYVRVVIPTQTSGVVFAKLIPGIPTTVNINAEAVAGQQPRTKVCNGLAPFSPSRRDINPFCQPDCNGTDPYFGFTIGQYYTLRDPGTWNPQQAQDICADKGINGQTGNFGLADPDGCGTNTPCFRDTVVNGSSGNCVQLGNDLPTTTGNKGINVQNSLWDRFQQDCVQSGGGNNDPPLSYSDYFNATKRMEDGLDPLPNSTCGLWRRILPVAVNDGTIPNGQGTYNVVGMGCFYMPFHITSQPPSSNICLQFVGTCDESGRPTGTSGGPSITRIVLFR